MENEKFRNIILTGMRGSGKTTLGKLLAKELNMDFIDTDKEIEESEEITISEMVERFNWEYFRKKEKECIEKVSKEVRNSIISTGGGVILYEENIINLKKNGVIVFINTPVEILSRRIKNTQTRPSLTGKNVQEELGQVWIERKDKYLESADFVYDKNNERLNKDDALGIIQLITDYELRITN